MNRGCWTTDALGTETEFTYDAQGHVKSQTDRTAKAIGGVDPVMLFDYDPDGNLTLRSYAAAQRDVMSSRSLSLRRVDNIIPALGSIRSEPRS